MSPVQSRADVPRALEWSLPAARGLTEWPDAFAEQVLVVEPGGLGDGLDNFQLNQRSALAFLVAALLPLPHAAAPTLVKAVSASLPDTRLAFLPLSRGPPSSLHQPVSEATRG